MPETRRVVPVLPVDPGAVAVRPLDSGDRLARDEFHRRYLAMPEGFRAELVEGVVYVPSPLRQRYHGRPHALLTAWAVRYSAATPGVDPGCESSVFLDDENEPQPDVLLRIVAERGGQSAETADGYIERAPELVGEVAASTASYDLHSKREAYRRNGVREYIVWRVFDREIDWFVLRDGRFEAITADTDGLARSEVFPGLWLDARALVSGEMQTVFAAVDRGLASPQHAAFVERLERAARA